VLEEFFFKCEYPEMKNWYEVRLGLKTDQHDTLFEWRSADKPGQKAYTH